MGAGRRSTTAARLGTAACKEANPIRTLLAALALASCASCALPPQQMRNALYTADPGRIVFSLQSAVIDSIARNLAPGRTTRGQLGDPDPILETPTTYKPFSLDDHLASMRTDEYTAAEEASLLEAFKQLSQSEHRPATSFSDSAKPRAPLPSIEPAHRSYFDLFVFNADEGQAFEIEVWALASTWGQNKTVLLPEVALLDGELNVVQRGSSLLSREVKLTGVLPHSTRFYVIVSANNRHTGMAVDFGSAYVSGYSYVDPKTGAVHMDPGYSIPYSIESSPVGSYRVRLKLRKAKPQT